MARKWTNETVDDFLRESTVTRVHNLTNIKQPSTTKTLWMCRCCNNNWHATFDSIRRGSRCPDCAGNTKQTLDVLQQKLQNRTINIISVQQSGSRNAERKGTFSCGVCSTQWETILSNVYSANQGCPGCGHRGKYTQTVFERNTNLASTPAVFYVVKMYDGDEVFLKVGITIKDAYSRLKTSIPYTSEVLHQHPTTLAEGHRLELIASKQLIKYAPKMKFGGHTECFALTELTKILTIMDSNEN